MTLYDSHVSQHNYGEAGRPAAKRVMAAQLYLLGRDRVSTDVNEIDVITVGHENKI